MTRKTVLDRVEITRNGSAQVRFAKEIWDGTELVASAWHRTVIDLGDDADTQLAAVSAHLTQMGYPEVSAADIGSIKTLIAAGI